MTEAGFWLRMDLPVHDSAGVRRAFGRAIAGRELLFLNWSEVDGFGSEIGYSKPPTRGNADEIAQAVRDGAYGQSVTSLTREAAAWLGVSKTTFDRLANGTSRHLRWSVVASLERKLKPIAPREWAELERHLLARGVRRALHEYVAYVDRERTRMHERRRGEKHRYAWSTSAEREAVESIRQIAATLGLPATRGELALERAAAPLIGWSQLRGYRGRGHNSRASLFLAGLKVERRALRVEAGLLRRAIVAGNKPRPR